MKWELLDPHEANRVIDLFESIYGQEAGILEYSRDFLLRNLTVASTLQMFDKSKEFIAVCKGNLEVPTRAGNVTYTDRILGACWFDRGGYASYSTREISNAKFHHVDLTLPTTTRVRIINQMIDQHILWAHNWGIPVVCSTSVRKEHDVFIRIHEKRGFTVHGSFAWIDTEEGMKWIR